MTAVCWPPAVAREASADGLGIEPAARSPALHATTAINKVNDSNDKRENNFDTGTSA